MTPEQLNALAHYAMHLWERWQSEQQYEDFNDYKEAARKRLAEVDARITHKSLRTSVNGALTWKFNLDKSEFTVSVNAKGATIKEMQKS